MLVTPISSRKNGMNFFHQSLWTLFSSPPIEKFTNPTFLFFTNVRIQGRYFIAISLPLVPVKVVSGGQLETLLGEAVKHIVILKTYKSVIPELAQVKGDSENKKELYNENFAKLQPQIQKVSPDDPDF
jgi:hypothetical protein